MSKYSEIDTSRTVIVGCGLEVVYVVYYSIFESRKKIGMAVEQSLGARLSQFVQTGAPSSLVVELIILTNNAASIEHAIHARLQKYRVRGEWFDIQSLWNVINLSEFGELASPSSSQAELFELEQELQNSIRRQENLLEVERNIRNRIDALADHLGVSRGNSESYGEFLTKLRSQIEGIFWKEEKINQTKILLRGWESKISTQEKEISNLKEELAKKESQIVELQERATQDSRRWRLTRPFGT